MIRETAEIHVYFDDAYESRYTPYTVSRIDSDGSEIVCEGAEDNLADAWKWGCSLADDYRVPCVEFADAAATNTNQETDRYEPEPKNEDE